MEYLPDIYKYLQSLIEKRIPSAIACVISRTGSGPREAGAMMLIAEDRVSAGTVGGGTFGGPGDGFRPNRNKIRQTGM